MNKAQLIEALAERLSGDRKAAGTAVDGLVDVIVRTVNKGEKVNITGFGVFEKRARAARTARNPRTGESVKVIQARLGHKSAVETLDTYGHLWPDTEVRTRSAIDLALGEIEPDVDHS